MAKEDDLCFFVSDLHGRTARYNKLFAEIVNDKPKIVFIGGDLLPSIGMDEYNDLDFLNDFLVKGLLEIKDLLGSDFPKIFIILGNDDPRVEEEQIIEAEKQGVWEYSHFRKLK